MLLKAGLIRLAGGHGGRREKPYRAVARNITVAPEMLSANTHQRRALVNARGGATRTGEVLATGRFRVLTDALRIDPDRLADLIDQAINQAHSEYDPELEPIVLSVFVHPPATSE